MSTEDKVEKIVEAIDESTMLGAGWDCLSDAAKIRFKNKLKAILDAETARCTPEPTPV